MSTLPGKYVFPISSVSKQTTAKGGQNRHLLPITFHSYPLDKRLCIVELLSAYLKRTAPLRKETKQLLICHAEPHGPASRDTLDKTNHKDAGIDTTVFKPHSTRGASTSAAKALNVPVQVVMNTAEWRSDSTFDRPVLTANSFAAAILGDKKL